MLLAVHWHPRYGLSYRQVEDLLVQHGIDVDRATNALRHSLEARPGRGSLRIVAEDDGPEINITVEDDGVGIDPDRLQDALNGSGTTSHVGILATDTRLRSTFGPEYGLMIATATDQGTKVTTRLPKNRPSRS